MRPRLAAATVAAVIALSAWPAPGAASPHWQALPGAPDLDIDLSSLHLQDGQAGGWLRTAGGGAAGWGAQAGPRPAGAGRSAGLLRFDCRTRSVRVLATLSWDRHGKVLQASDVPGPRRRLSADDPLLNAYDALCELARSPP